MITTFLSGFGQLLFKRLFMKCLVVLLVLNAALPVQENNNNRIYFFGHITRWTCWEYNWGSNSFTPKRCMYLSACFGYVLKHLMPNVNIPVFVNFFFRQEINVPGERVVVSFGKTRGPPSSWGQYTVLLVWQLTSFSALAWDHCRLKSDQ